LRIFSEWAGQEIEKVCQRNDQPRPGKQLKPAWEILLLGDLFLQLEEELVEVVEAYHRYLETPGELNRQALQWELADLAAVAMMLSANIDPVLSTLRRGKRNKYMIPLESPEKKKYNW